MELPQLDNYKELFLSDIEMLDVRAPIEFNQGAFPHTQNIPLMTDEERQSVGIEYKEQGQQSAIELGHQLVSGEVKQRRIEQWADFFKRHPDGVLYCFRGGLRSRITQQWIYENTGMVYPRVKGGYKAMRRFLIDELERAAQEMQFIILSGRTGIGKTLLLDRLKQKVDLEGIFHHRGSAFGAHATSQPSQIDIENSLSIELLRHQQQGSQTIILEDESASIGSRKVPDCLLNKMKQSSIILLEADTEERINIVFDEYIVNAKKEFEDCYGQASGVEKWAESLLNSLYRIKRRLGGDRHKELNTIMIEALTSQHNQNDLERHKDWIRVLLVDYYDPMYDYQLSRKSDRILFRGSQDEVIDFLKRQNIS